MPTPTLMIFGVILMFLLSLMLTYLVIIFNDLVRLNNNIKKARVNIDVLLKQRSDELPKLVSVVKGYMKYEKSVFKLIIKARKDITSTKGFKEKAKSNIIISEFIKNTFKHAEDYPKLQSNEQFLYLHQRISNLEDSISDRIEFYNDCVNVYNLKIAFFPRNLFTMLLRYKKYDLFENVP